MEREGCVCAFVSMGCCFSRARAFFLVWGLACGRACVRGRGRHGCVCREREKGTGGRRQDWAPRAARRAWGLASFFFPFFVLERDVCVQTLLFLRVRACVCVLVGSDGAQHQLLHAKSRVTSSHGARWRWWGREKKKRASPLSHTVRLYFIHARTHVTFHPITKIIRTAASNYTRLPHQQLAAVAQ